jgi:hypothetical protein
MPPTVPPFAKRGGSKASAWPASASFVSSSASGVPARTVTTSSLGSWLLMPDSTVVSSGSPCGASPYQALVPPPRMSSPTWRARASSTRSTRPASTGSAGVSGTAAI